MFHSLFFVILLRYATILAFDVKVEREAQEMADSVGVKIFQADIIYHLFDKFMAYREELKQKKREEFRSIAVFPCKLKVRFLKFLNFFLCLWTSKYILKYVCTYIWIQESSKNILLWFRKSTSKKWKKENLCISCLEIF